MMGSGDKDREAMVPLDEGWGPRLATGFIWFALFASLFVFHAWSQFRGLKSAEAMEQAQLGRNLAEGRGFTTRSIRPSELVSRDRGAAGVSLERCPDVRHAPLYPLVLGGAFKIVRPPFAVERRELFAPEPRVLIPLNSLLILCTGWFVFRIAGRLFDRRAAWLAAVVFFISRTALEATVSGTSDAMAMLLSAGACDLALAAVRRQERGGATLGWGSALAGSALCCGLAFLTAYPLIVLVPAVAVFLVSGLTRGRWLALALFLVVVGAVAMPWLARNLVVSGRLLGTAPTEVMASSAWFPGDALARSLDPDISNVKVAQAIQDKLTRNLPAVFEGDIRSLGTGLLVCFFLVSFFHRFDDETTGRFRWGLALGLLLLAGVQAATRGPSAGMLNVFWPIVAAYGAGFFFLVVDRAEFFHAGWDQALAWLMVALTALPSVVKLMTSAPLPYPPYYPPLVAFVSGRMEKGEAVATDIPWATAWYGGTPSVQLPRSVEDFNRLREKHPEIRGVYLAGGSTEPAGSPWTMLRNYRVPDGFPFTNAVALPPGTHDQLFVTDRARWP